MPNYINCSPAPWEDIPTKAALKRAMKDKPDTTEFRDTDGRTLTIREIPDNSVLSVTNHPKRSWFATVTKAGKVT